MSKGFRWHLARRNPPEPRETRLEREIARTAEAILAEPQPVEPKRKPARKADKPAGSPLWPACVTLGGHPVIPGALTVLYLANAEEARQLGVPWVGRPL